MKDLVFRNFWLEIPSILIKNQFARFARNARFFIWNTRYFENIWQSYSINLYLTLNIFFSCLFTSFYRMLQNSIYQFVNNLYNYILKHFVDTKILFCSQITEKYKCNSSAPVTKTWRLVVRNTVDNLMLCIDESNGPFRLQNNIVHQLQSIQVITIFKTRPWRKSKHT